MRQTGTGENDKEIETFETRKTTIFRNQDSNLARCRELLSGFRRGDFPVRPASACSLAPAAEGAGCPRKLQTLAV